MPSDDGSNVELQRLDRPEDMEEEEIAAGASNMTDDFLDENDPITGDVDAQGGFGSALDRRTKRKLDCILLPFLSVLFLLNSLDKSNIGNAETAGFTEDAGLDPDDLNTSMAYFFAFFVALQPVGAAFGRRYGMARWVPGCMSVWGFCTLLHMWVRKKWQLILLRIMIATLEAGFYPTTVSYLSLFYTRYEFAVRLGFFYGQTAVSGVLGGILSWAVFSRFEKGPSRPTIPPPAAQAESGTGWKSWEVLFLIEGCMTMVIALIGFFWLPHSADTAWFFSAEEQQWAEARIRLDQRDTADRDETAERLDDPRLSSHGPDNARDHVIDNDADDEDIPDEPHHHLLYRPKSRNRRMSTFTGISVTEDAGLTRHDVLSAFLNFRIWHVLFVNILSASSYTIGQKVPAVAFSVFLPMVIKQLSPSLNLSPSASNLLAAPPFAMGAIVLFGFSRWSDRSKRRLKPILWGLGLLLIGLAATVLIPTNNYILRYLALCLLLSGSFIASPLTVAWLANNTPEPGKRTILLGINGWGNLAGLFLAILFTPADRKNGYIRPFIITLVCVLTSFAGYVAFWILLVRENKYREQITSNWSEQEKEREDNFGDMPIPLTISSRMWQLLGLQRLARILGLEDVRTGDEKLTFRYGL